MLAIKGYFVYSDLIKQSTLLQTKLNNRICGKTGESLRRKAIGTVKCQPVAFLSYLDDLSALVPRWDFYFSAEPAGEEESGAAPLWSE